MDRPAHFNACGRALGTLPVSEFRLLKLGGGTGFLQLLDDGLGVGLADGLFDRRRHGLDEVLGFLEAQRRDFADRLDDVDLVGANVLDDDVELALLFDGGRMRSQSARTLPASSANSEARKTVLEGAAFTGSRHSAQRLSPWPGQ